MSSSYIVDVMGRGGGGGGGDGFVSREFPMGFIWGFQTGDVGRGTGYGE